MTDYLDANAEIRVRAAARELEAAKTYLPDDHYAMQEEIGALITVLRCLSDRLAVAQEEDRWIRSREEMEKRFSQVRDRYLSHYPIPPLP